MGNTSGWDSRGECSVFDAHPNYLTTRPAEETNPFNAWTVAVIAYLLGSGAFMAPGSCSWPSSRS